MTYELPKDVKCPYCGFEQDIDHDDGVGFEENKVWQQLCQNSECEKTFVYSTYIHYDYKVKQADCLNEGKHDWKPVHIFPECFSFATSRCSICEEEKCFDPEGKDKAIKEYFESLKIE